MPCCFLCNSPCKKSFSRGERTAKGSTGLSTPPSGSGSSGFVSSPSDSEVSVSTWWGGGGGGAQFGRPARGCAPKRGEEGTPPAGGGEGEEGEGGERRAESKDKEGNEADEAEGATLEQQGGRSYTREAWRGLKFNPTPRVSQVATPPPTPKTSTTPTRPASLGVRETG